MAPPPPQHPTLPNTLLDNDWLRWQGAACGRGQTDGQHEEKQKLVNGQKLRGTLEDESTDGDVCPHVVSFGFGLFSLCAGAAADPPPPRPHAPPPTRVDQPKSDDVYIIVEF